ncbi:MAG: nuclear transport factor 2 family protein [Candidatus Nanopelagicales bacterium]
MADPTSTGPNPGTTAGLAQWHAIVESRDPARLDALLAEDAVFTSPIVHTPQVGKGLTTMYLTGAMHVLGNGSFTYVREVVDGPNAVLEFETIVDGITVNGVDMIRFDETGQIVDFKVMLRPMKAINLVGQKMAAMLESLR